MMRTEHQSSIDVKKSYTSYKWTLNECPLLCYQYYSIGISSHKFFLSNTGCTCSMSLRYVGGVWRLTINHGENLDGLWMKIAASLVDNGIKKKHMTKKVFAKPFPNEFTVDLGVDITKDCSQYLTKDALILLTEFTIVESIGNSELQTQNFNENATNNLRDNLREIHASNSFHDFTFVIGEKEFSAHKVILAANSEVFRAMFSTKMKEEETNIVEIDDIDATVFEEFLSYMYSGKVNNLKNIASELIIVAGKYLMYDLKQLCLNYMSWHITNENAIQYLLVFHKLNCAVPKTKVVKFIKANPHVLANPADYKILYDYPELIKEVFGN